MRKMVRYLLVYLPILIGFGLAFFVLLKKDVKQQRASVFRGDLMIMTIAAMFIGAVDVDQVTASEGSEYKAWLWSPAEYVVRIAIFLFFLLAVPVVMMNMLLALTISDSNQFLSRGSSEYLRHTASLTAVSQRAVFSLFRCVQALQDRLPSRLGCLASVLLCVKWRSVLPRQFDDGSSTVTLVVCPAKDNDSRARVTVYGSKRRYSVHRSLWCDLNSIVQERETAEAAQTVTERRPLSDPPQPGALQTPSDHLRKALELQEALAQQLEETKKLTNHLGELSQEILKRLDNADNKLPANRSAAADH
ncbi:hypothetical protein FJT64_012223 [Amphibalanus amphitrite]|uniref:Transient receptor potential channel pyrexia n=1 Tax=Amphibalanus amphitrite TaxID=1232801 RepID=A0A6A4V097_AMPAM|nr:hypothetical protein FJT64_012223 [Amphibalanus amphitrite]